MDQSAPPALLEIRGMAKAFPGVQALLDIDLDLRAGEVHALVGENGAGKSTLMKIVAGVYRPDGGSVQLAGQPVLNESPRQALERGISMIHQELNLAPNLSVAENVFLGRAPTRGGLIDWQRLYADAEALAARLGIELDVRAHVEELSVAGQQMVETAKALSLDARVIIMDEPTSALTERETEALFDIIDRLRRQGVAVVYISHRLDEIFRVADRVTVLRDGRLVGTLPVAQSTQQQLIGMMVGRELTTLFPKEPLEIGEPVLEVRRLRRDGVLDDISFVLRRREILGLAGLVGAGRTELARVLILDEPTRGIDVAAKAEVHALMSRLARDGVSILMISSELPEILGMSDRILVMRQGRLTGEFTREQASQEAILACAA